MSGRFENGSLLLGRVLLAACFIPSGFAKLSNISGFAVSLAAAGLPSSQAVATACVLANVFGPAALVVGVAPRFAAGVLVAVTTVTTALLHRFWDLEGMVRKTEQAIFLAHLGIIAGLLFYAVSGPGAWSWQGWWRGTGARPAAPATAKKRARAARAA